MLREERNGLFSSLNLVEDLVDVSPSPDEVRCPHFHDLFLVRVFIVVDNSLEGIHVDRFNIETLEIFLFQTLHLFFLNSTIHFLSILLLFLSLLLIYRRKLS